MLYNIVGFARDSVRAHVTTLRPDNFPSDRKEPWLVDFFAPVRNRRRRLRPDNAFSRRPFFPPQPARLYRVFCDRSRCLSCAAV